MESVNPLLPALRPDTPALLRRTGSLLGAVQGIQQEASAEYWFGLLQNQALSTGQRKSIEIRCSDLLRRDIEAALKVLEEHAKQTDADGDEKYMRPYGDVYGWFFDVDDFYNDYWELFDALFSNQHKLAQLQNDPASQAQIMLDGANFIKEIAPSTLYTKYLSSALLLDYRITTIQELTKYDSYWGEAEFVLTHIIDNNPNEQEPYLRRAWRRENACRYGEALKDLDVYISLVQTNASAFKLRGRVRNFLGDVSGMLEDAKAAERLGAVLEKWWLDPPTELPF